MSGSLNNLKDNLITENINKSQTPKSENQIYDQVLIEDILYTASNARKVLFKDIAGEMVLFAKYGPYYSAKHEKRTTSDHEKQFTDFELITDKATLVELNNNLSERLENEFIGIKTAEWQSSNDLRVDETFPYGQLTLAQIGIPERDIVRVTVDGKEKFLEVKSDK